MTWACGGGERLIQGVGWYIYMKVRDNLGDLGIDE
jgi:hypothetical protein